MTTISCKDSAEVSCIIGNILAELEQPCQSCQPDGAVVLTGRSPAGGAVTVRMLPGHVLELNQKTNIFPLRNGVDFCGFHVYLTQTGKVIKKLRHSSSKRMKRRIRKWEEQYAAGEITREKIEESYVAWEAHAKHGDTGALRKQMRARLSAAMARAEHRRAALRLPAPEPGKIERRTKRYGTVNFQSGRRQPGEAGGADQTHQVHQAGE